MEAGGSSDILVSFNRSTRRHIPGTRDLSTASTLYRVMHAARWPVSGRGFIPGRLEYGAELALQLSACRCRISSFQNWCVYATYSFPPNWCVNVSIENRFQGWNEQWYEFYCVAPFRRTWWCGWRRDVGDTNEEVATPLLPRLHAAHDNITHRNYDRIKFKRCFLSFNSAPLLFLSAVWRTKA
jgi:hypothetical protein